jgi:hypothetical protein
MVKAGDAIVDKNVVVVVVDAKKSFQNTPYQVQWKRKPFKFALWSKQCNFKLRI